MIHKVFLAAGLLAGLGVAQAYAQAGSGASAPVTPPATATGPETRVPALGDTNRTPPPPRRVTRRQRHAPLPPQNGNQPDRAGAGAGGR